MVNKRLIGRYVPDENGKLRHRMSLMNRDATAYAHAARDNSHLSIFRSTIGLLRRIHDRMRGKG